MRFLFFFILSLSFFKSFSDAGNAYRFYTEVTLKNETKITGYIYHSSYSEYDKYTAGNLLNFLKKDYKKSIQLYTHIIPICLNNRILDFSSKEFKQTLNFDDIDMIRTHEALDYQVGEKLIELSKREFDLIKTSKPYLKNIYNEQIAENCYYLIVSWKSKSIIDEEEKLISKHLNQLTNSKNIDYKPIYTFIETKKEELFKQGIILINYCESL